MAAGYPVQVSETHGMAQRGGVVESTVVLGSLASPIISLGEADILLGFEILETFRSMNRCRPGALVVTNTGVNVPYTVAIGQAVYPPVEQLLTLLRAQTGRVIALNANALAQEAGSALAVNMVLLGALIRSGQVPFSPATFEPLIAARTPKPHLETNLRAFKLGLEAAAAFV